MPKAGEGVEAKQVESLFIAQLQRHGITNIVFDLDGTILAERPKTFEQILTDTRLMEKLAKKPELINVPVYKAIKEHTPGFFRKLRFPQ